MRPGTCLLQVLILLVAGLLPLCECKPFFVDGYVTHGINTFNSRPIVDFSSASNIFTTAGPLHEIGVLNPGGENGSRITDATPTSARLVTVDATQFRDAFGTPRGVGPFNVPIANTPTLFFGSNSVNDRKKPRRFESSASPDFVSDPYLSAGANPDIRLRNWNAARGSVSGRCRRDGTAFVVIKIRNGLPQGVYSIWDIGVRNALTDKESLSVSTFGGSPNALVTDRRGNGKARRELLYCPTQKCKGSKRCTLYVSLFYHFDHMLYGSTPTLDNAGPAIGNIASNHVQIFFNGEVLQNRRTRKRW